MSAIDDKYAALGGAGGLLGAPVSPEQFTPDRIGCYRHYRGGSIYWTRATGAWAVHGAIRAKWAALGWERSILGYPLTDETRTPDGVGRFNHFQGGSIYWTRATGAWEVHGAIRAKWAALDWERSVLGYPLTDETPTPDGVGRLNHFQGGSIYWTRATEAWEVHGAIRAKWAALRWERSVLGYPLTDETPTPDGVGRFNHFQGGSIYWTPATGAWEVHGAIRDLWSSLGWERSALGYPVSDELDTPLGRGKVSHFQRGSVYWDPGRGPYEVFPPPPPRVCDPSREGRWEIASYASGVVGMHAALLHTNAVLFFAYREPADHADPGPIPPPLGSSAVLDLSSGSLATPVYAGESGATEIINIFCSGHAFLPDGRLLVAGGDREDPRRIRSLHVFTPGGPRGGSWQYVGQCADGRWYPTCATLPDGKVIIIGGERRTPTNFRSTTFEVFDPFTSRVGPLVDAPPLAGFAASITYPFLFVLPSGRLLIHGGTRTVFLNLGTWTFETLSLEAATRPGRQGRTYGVEGTSVLLPLLQNSTPSYRPRVMMMGGGGTPVSVRTPATRSCEILDLGAASPTWALAAPMARPRVMPDAVLLPDGTVLVMNGSSTGFADNGANPVYDAELYNPATNIWTTLCPMQVPRLYHATALLLPDGRVMTAGTDSVWNPDPFHEAELRVEVFSPPYLFRGARPSIHSAPAEVRYNATFAVETPDAAAIASVALIRCGSVTHSFNSDQRHVGLSITGRTSNTLTLRAPPNGFIAPPGYYMLFILNGSAVPSVARFVRLR